MTAEGRSVDSAADPSPETESSREELSSLDELFVADDELVESESELEEVDDDTAAVWFAPVNAGSRPAASWM